MRIDFRSKVWPSEDARPEWAKPVTAEGWGFFSRPPKDIVKLLEVYSRQNTLDFANDDAALSDLMVRKALRAERWRQRTRFHRLLWNACARRARYVVAVYVRPRYLSLLARLKLVAEKEATLQASETAKDE